MRYVLITLGILSIIGGYAFFNEDKLGQVTFRPSYIDEGGIISFPYKLQLNTASTTYCAKRSPEATSTIEFVSVDIRTATSGVNLIQIGKSVNNNTATTTLLASLTLPSGARGTLVATSSLQSADNWIIPPSNASSSNWVVINGAGFGSKKPTGNCQIIFKRVSE